MVFGIFWAGNSGRKKERPLPRGPSSSRQADLLARGYCSFAGLKAAGLIAAGLSAAGLNAAGLRAAGFSAAGLRAAGLNAAGRTAAARMAAGFNAAGFTAAARMAAGFTVPEAAEPLSGVAATIAFLVVFKELIRDFFWIVIISWLLAWFLTSPRTLP
jgi:hypothetical protein